MKLSIVIVSWNTRDLLAACLDSIAREQDALAGAAVQVETFVVDNVSRDGSAVMVQEHYPWVRLLVNEENVGFARANNQALALCQGDYVLLLNPDTELQPGALGTLLAFMDDHPEAGAAGARLLNGDGTLQESCSPAPTLARECWRLLHLDRLYPYARYPMGRWPVDRPRQVDVVQGAALLVRRSVLDQVGWLDPDYFIYSEEVDFCRRIRAAGWAIYWVPTAAVVHYGGQSTQQVAAEMFLRLYQAKIIYFRKHGGRWATGLYKAILFLAALARLILVPFTALQHSLARKRNLALAGNYLRLIAALPRL
ncbi:glycosyltransferase family 2 protein [Litorilinea aerophila]|uniref:glycosyltransferase family 2 protein n=1 Tax=Litorilinea aerophila TaxID=1204385 RepID=UPI0014776C2E|nr:glycosyltransferase family 2 protein [Litorilinea aerophila]MCC9076788.1 glycosyltransferase family 2 protein [Litorilinea aerophila]